MSEAIKYLNDADFKDFVEKSDLPVLVDFWAEWCGPCRMIAPVLEEVAGEYAGKIQVSKVNVDENRTIPAEYRVSSIPTLVVLKNGTEVERIIGYRNKNEIKEIMDKYL